MKLNKDKEEVEEVKRKEKENQIKSNLIKWWKEMGVERKEYKGK